MFPRNHRSPHRFRGNICQMPLHFQSCLQTYLKQDDKPGYVVGRSSIQTCCCQQVQATYLKRDGPPHCFYSVLLRLGCHKGHDDLTSSPPSSGLSPAVSLECPALPAGYQQQGLRSLRDLTQHLTTRADDNHAPPVSSAPKRRHYYVPVRGMSRFGKVLRVASN